MARNREGGGATAPPKGKSSPREGGEREFRGDSLPTPSPGWGGGYIYISRTCVGFQLQPPAHSIFFAFAPHAAILRLSPRAQSDDCGGKRRSRTASLIVAGLLHVYGR